MANPHQRSPQKTMMDYLIDLAIDRYFEEKENE